MHKPQSSYQITTSFLLYNTLTFTSPKFICFYAKARVRSQALLWITGSRSQAVLAQVRMFRMALLATPLLHLTEIAIESRITVQHVGDSMPLGDRRKICPTDGTWRWNSTSITFVRWPLGHRLQSLKFLIKMWIILFCNKNTDKHN